MRRALPLLLVLLSAAPVAAQEFFTDFNTDDPSLNFGFTGKGPNPTIPSGRTIEWLETGGWQGTGAARITINGCTTDCSGATNQGDVGWFVSSLGGSYTAGVSKKYGKFRIRMDSPMTRTGTKLTDFGSVGDSRVIAKLGLPYDTNVGCHPTGEGNDFFGSAVPDTDPTNAWQRATGAESFGLGATFRSMDLGTEGTSSSQSNYAMWTIGSGISWNCAKGFAILPYYAAVGDIQPQNNAAPSQHGWVHIQWEAMSGASCGASAGGYKVWVNNNDYNNPTFQLTNVIVDFGDCPLGVTNWGGQYVFGGTWGQGGTNAVVVTFDDVGFSNSFDDEFYELEDGGGDSTPRPMRRPRRRAALETRPVLPVALQQHGVFTLAM